MANDTLTVGMSSMRVRMLAGEHPHAHRRHADRERVVCHGGGVNAMNKRELLLRQVKMAPMACACASSCAEHLCSDSSSLQPQRGCRTANLSGTKCRGPCVFRIGLLYIGPHNYLHHGPRGQSDYHHGFEHCI